MVKMKNSVSTDMLHMELKQLGASVIKAFPTKAVVIVFNIDDDLTVSYFCHVRDEEVVSLQRIEPYPIKDYRFDNVDSIIEFIKQDVNMFRNASNSSNFKKFLDIIEKNYQARKDMEDLFLMSNVSPEVLDTLENLEDEFLGKIKNIEKIQL